MSQASFDTVIVRFGGEIGIKAEWTRKLYERRLMTNIKAVLKNYSLSHTALPRKFGRIYIKTRQAEETAEKLKKVFGISSLSPSLETTSTLDDILKVSLNLVQSKFKKGKTFSVRCHRIGKHSYSSQEVCRQVGQSILNQLPSLNLKVNLGHPEQTLHIEVRDDKAYVYTAIVPGPGGLPLGTQPTLVHVLDDDVSSAAACWLTMKRGCPPILLHFESNGSTNKSEMEKITHTARRMMEWSMGFPRNLYLIKQDQHFSEIAKRCSPEMAALLRRRLILQIAQRICRMKNAEGIVIGDSIRESTKRTIHVFRLQDEASEGYPIYRPLVGKDTSEIEDLARAIGLKTVILKAKRRNKRRESAEGGIELDEVQKIEKEMNTSKIVEDALDSLKVLRI